jgi:hypothetical protein
MNSRAGGYGSVTPRERRDAPDAYLIADFRFSPSFARKSCVFLHAWPGPISAAVLANRIRRVDRHRVVGLVPPFDA